MDKIVGNNLKLLRESNGYTQEQAARLLKIKRSAYSNYEAGERTAPLAVLEAAAKAYCIELSMLFEADNDSMKSLLLHAFRAEELDKDDMDQLNDFKSIAISYLKINRLLGL
ncbi:MAG: helix-turn-helix transcriptional regulator [Bacteroidales bacterium]|nr:helix-turn-helix transcriptional regulator [Bacteroidales bacterium]